ncbi:hypothetical protein MtrunA17_Chr1g0199861 [Medicago truncatula]|uniref:Uncharacterized protein n=1 Tax=Medicago truncatula TaxID=3880 RepID=A0A396K043_MEDTR|nr:hypothetical protein MtrunA17_Chr1g0199861 [Medicago truncatula]
MCASYLRHTYIVQQSSHGIVIFKVTGLCFLTAEQSSNDLITVWKEGRHGKSARRGKLR